MSAMDTLPRNDADSAVAAVKSVATVYGRGVGLYAALSARIAEDPEIVSLLGHGLAGQPGAHLFAAAHYLLLKDPSDPLARYYGTLTAHPGPPDEAFPAFARFCRTHRDELVELLETRTVQTTGPDRCQILMPMLSRVASMAGAPLSLIEIGCSAGILLTFDKYAYAPHGRPRLGPAGAPLTFNPEVRGGPDLHIPAVNHRIGLDLHLVDARSDDDRRWLLAQSAPEQSERQARLATALDVVAQTDIRFIEGHALAHLADVIAATPGPLCVYHSACLMYWNAEGRAALDALLLEASREREFFRVGMEPDLQRPLDQDRFMDIEIAVYRDGRVDSKVAAFSGLDGASLTWLD